MEPISEQKVAAPNTGTKVFGIIVVLAVIGIAFYLSYKKILYDRAHAPLRAQQKQELIDKHGELNESLPLTDAQKKNLEKQHAQPIAQDSVPLTADQKNAIINKGQ